MKARKGGWVEGWIGAERAPLTESQPRNIREPNRWTKGMKGVSQIKSARSTAGTKERSRISLVLALEIRKRFSSEAEMPSPDTRRGNGEPDGGT